MDQLLKGKVQAEEMITIEEMTEALNCEVWKEGTELFKITQSFVKRGRSTYLIRYPEIEEDLDMVMFNDPDSIIEGNRLVLNGFLKSSVERVSRFKSEDTNKYQYKIQLSDGHVLIEPLLS
jgi:hypothetical protein